MRTVLCFILNIVTQVSILWPFSDCKPVNMGIMVKTCQNTESVAQLFTVWMFCRHQQVKQIKVAIAYCQFVNRLWEVNHILWSSVTQTACKRCFLFFFFLWSLNTTTFHVTSNDFLKFYLFKMFLCRAAGGGYPGRGQSPGPVDFAAAPAGLALHPVLCLQALR